MKPNQRSNNRVFWAVADYFRARKGARWVPSNAGYELRAAVPVHGEEWIVSVKAHVAPQDAPRRAAGVRVDLMSSVTLWPPESKSEASSEATQARWRAVASRILRKNGYRGAWRASPWGTFGDFWKHRLPSVPAVRRETKVLEEILRALGAHTDQRRDGARRP